MLTLPHTPHPLQTHSEVQLPPVLHCPVVSKARNRREIAARGRSALRPPRQQLEHTKARPPVHPDLLVCLRQPATLYILAPSHGAFFCFCYHTEAEYLVVSTVVTLACIYQFSQTEVLRSLGRTEMGTKKNCWHVTHMLITLT